jgi:hypothetical protein
MLVVVQFPISDARAFATTPTARLSVPEWPEPVTFGNPQFVRQFGPAAERTLGPDAAWTDERVYCRARRAVKFPNLRQARVRAGAATVQPFVVFRRLFCDRTTAVTRVEIGFAAKLPTWAPGMAATTVESMVRDFLGLDTDVFDRERGTHVRADLSEQGPRLARLFAFATSRRRGAAATPEELALVGYGRPTVVAEFDDAEVLALPQGARPIEDANLSDAELVFYGQTTSMGPVPAWLLRRGKTPEPVLRSLRLCLLRLHAEGECLDRVLSHVHAGRITYEHGTPPSDRLSQYLDDSTAILEKRRSRGIQQSQLLAAMNAAASVALPFKTEASLDGISGVQRQIRIKVERYALERSGPRVEAGGTYVDSRSNVNVQGSTVNAPITGSINAQQISDSFKSVVTSSASDEVKEAVVELKAAIDQILPTLAEAEAKKVSTSFDIIAKQAAEPDPIEALVLAAGKTLVEVGQRVGDLAKPISAGVNAVLNALKFAAILL